MDWTWEEEQNHDGTLDGCVGYFGSGGRECNKAYFSIEKLDEDDECYYVKAVCTDSELRRIQVGDEVEYNIPKDSSLWDLDSLLQEAVEDMYN